MRFTEPNGPKVAYFDWDKDYLYVAWESPTPEPVRIDLDGSDDGFLRGADNLSVQINTPVSLDPDAYSTAVPFYRRVMGRNKKRRPATALTCGTTDRSNRCGRGTHFERIICGDGSDWQNRTRRTATNRWAKDRLASGIGRTGPDTEWHNHYF